MTSADMEKQTMKASKPAMEKRRRARINDSLLQLKALVLDGLNKNNSRHSKLEKADILEMTVRYLRSVQRQQVKGSVEADPTVLVQYRTGFAECMGEVSRYLGGAINENPEVRARLIGHLAGMCTTTTMQPQQQQPIRYAVAHGQMQSPGPNPVQPLSMSTPAVTSASPGVLVAVPNPAQVPASSAHQPVTFSFPTPPLSGGGRQPQPATFMTSPVVQNKRGAGYNRTIVPQTQTNQNQQMSPVKVGNSAPPTPKTDLPTLSGKQPVMIAQMSNSAQSAPQQAGDMITLILPSQSLPGGQVPTHLIPVYAQEASKGVAPPLGFVLSSANPSAGDKNRSASFASSASSPNVASTAPSTATICQSGAWTAVPMPTAQLVTPQSNTFAPPVAITPTLALSVPLNAKISPPGLAVQAKQPTEAMGQPIQLPGVFQNVDATGHAGDTTPMWRPW